MTHLVLSAGRRGVGFPFSGVLAGLPDARDPLDLQLRARLGRGHHRALLQRAARQARR